MTRSQAACTTGRDATRDAAGVVVTLQQDAHNPANHESVTRNGIARRLADLKGYRFAGELDTAKPPAGRTYLVPADTIVGCDRAAELGIRGPDDLFGAVVPHGFMTAKTITHPLFDGTAHAPQGWCHGFCDAIRDAVLEGYAAFTPADLRRAVRTMLTGGPVRIKRASGIGGQGQHVVATLEEVDALLAEVDPDEIGSLGIVVEQNLRELVTHSVGQVVVAGLTASYWGTQRLTRNNRGHEVYGGSSLFVVRGDFEVLLSHPLSAEARRAIALARTYDAAALAHLPGMIASRRNYDVAIGADARANARGGVLESSWRLGGASGAEVAALQAFRADPACAAVRVTTTEIHGACAPPPPGAVVYFRGVDARIGMLTKFAMVEPHADP